MRGRHRIHSVEGMNTSTQAQTHQFNWPLIIGLGALALVRPALSIVESVIGVSDPATVPIAITIAISIVWIAVVGLRRITRPVLTLVLVGVTYAVLAIIVSGIVSPIVSGHLEGPLTNPMGVVSVLVVNAVWGLITGALALALRQIRGGRPNAGGPRA